MTTAAEKSMTLRLLHKYLSDRLALIAETLPREYRLTFVARHTTLPDGDIIIGDDDLEKAIAAIVKLKNRPDRVVNP